MDFDFSLQQHVVTRFSQCPPANRHTIVIEACFQQHLWLWFLVVELLKALCLSPCGTAVTHFRPSETHLGLSLDDLQFFGVGFGGLGFGVWGYPPVFSAVFRMVFSEYLFQSVSNELTSDKGSVSMCDPKNFLGLPFPFACFRTSGTIEQPFQQVPFSRLFGLTVRVEKGTC